MLKNICRHIGKKRSASRMSVFWGNRLGHCSPIASTFPSVWELRMPGDSDVLWTYCKKNALDSQGMDVVVTCLLRNSQYIIKRPDHGSWLSLQFPLGGFISIAYKCHVFLKLSFFWVVCKRFWCHLTTFFIHVFSDSPVSSASWQEPCCSLHRAPGASLPRSPADLTPRSH